MTEDLELKLLPNTPEDANKRIVRMKWVPNTVRGEWELIAMQLFDQGLISNVYAKDAEPWRLAFLKWRKENPDRPWHEAELSVEEIHYDVYLTIEENKGASNE